MNNVLLVSFVIFSDIIGDVRSRRVSLYPLHANNGYWLDTSIALTCSVAHMGVFGDLLGTAEVVCISYIALVPGACDRWETRLHLPGWLLADITTC